MQPLKHTENEQELLQIIERFAGFFRNRIQNLNSLLKFEDRGYKAEFYESEIALCNKVLSDYEEQMLNLYKSLYSKDIIASAKRDESLSEKRVLISNEIAEDVKKMIGHLPIYNTIKSGLELKLNEYREREIINLVTALRDGLNNVVENTDMAGAVYIDAKYPERYKTKFK